MKPHLTIGKLLSFPKISLNEGEISDTVYQVPGHDCKFTYVSQTKQDLKLQLDEQKGLSNSKDQRNLLSVNTSLLAITY